VRVTSAGRTALALAATLALAGCGDEPASAPTSAPTVAPFDPPSASVYPPADSRARGMTPSWQRFASQVDRACGVYYNAGLQERDAMELRAGFEQWSDRKEAAVGWAVEADAQLAKYRAIVALGRPPAEPALFRQWLDNVGLRGRLMLAVSRAWAGGDHAVVDRLADRILRLKATANRLGQRFGLRICTSNGPGRHPVPAGSLGSGNPPA
jgi:hypothetical protein